jgi:hypothetical protein
MGRLGSESDRQPEAAAGLVGTSGHTAENGPRGADLGLTSAKGTLTDGEAELRHLELARERPCPGLRGSHIGIRLRHRSSQPLTLELNRSQARVLLRESTRRALEVVTGGGDPLAQIALPRTRQRDGGLGRSNHDDEARWEQNRSYGRLCGPPRPSLTSHPAAHAATVTGLLPNVVDRLAGLARRRCAPWGYHIARDVGSRVSLTGLHRAG